MHRHPAEGMTKPCIDAFERIAVNQTPGCGARTLNALLKRGIVERTEDRVIRDRFGEYKVPQYCVPLGVHMQWCEWCSKNVVMD